jgi:hypothetical protein
MLNAGQFPDPQMAERARLQQKLKQLSMRALRTRVYFLQFLDVQNMLIVQLDDAVLTQQILSGTSIFLDLVQSDERLL